VEDLKGKWRNAQDKELHNLSSTLYRPIVNAII
jgi:hypothetical protein